MEDKQLWRTLIDTQLEFENAALNFLRNEFSELIDKQTWFDNYFNWKLNQVKGAEGYLNIGLCEKNIISTVSLTPRKILFDNEYYISGELGDSYCSNVFLKNIRNYKPVSVLNGESEYINKSVFGRTAFEITQLAIEKKFQLIYGTPNINAINIWINRLGYMNFSNHSIHLFVKPSFNLLVPKFLKKVLPKKSTYFFDYCLLNFSSIALKYIYNLNHNFKISDILLDEKKIQRLWESTKPLKGFCFVRDLEYWNNRYISHPVNKYKIKYISSNDQLIGIIVYYKKYINNVDFIIYIMEWMLLDKVSLSVVVNKILIDELKSGNFIKCCTYVNCNSKYKNEIIRCLFLKRNKVDIIFYPTTFLKNLISLNTSSFEFYLGNSDAF
jgi:hypothetical protein